MESKDQLDLTRMNRAVFEALEPAQLVELTCRLHTLAMELSERLALNSTNSSRPPSSDPPFGGGGDATGSYVGRRDGGPSEGATPPGAKEPPPSGRKPGKQPGAKGTWRDAPLKTERTESHWPVVCAHCGLAFEMWDAVVRTAEAFAVLELERTDRGIRIGCVQHRYEVMRCACGHQTAARPGTGRALVPGRAQAALAGERTQPDRSVAGRLHHRPGGAPSPVPPAHPRVPDDLVRRGAGGGHPRPLPARGRRRVRADRGGSARRGAGRRRHPCRRDPLVAGRARALAVGGAERHHRRLPYRQPPPRGNPRPARRRHPRLAGHRRVRRLSRLRPPSKVSRSHHPNTIVLKVLA